MRSAIVSILFILPCFLFGQEEKEKDWDLSGYAKFLQTSLFFNTASTTDLVLDNLIHNRLNYKHYFGDSWKLQVGLRNRIAYGGSVSVNPNYSELIDFGANDIFDLSSSWINENNLVAHSVIDRAYLDYVVGDWEFRMGRQRINWGISSVWNPNDIFNAFSFTDFDYEERPGSDAMLIRKYTGFASSVELAFKLSAKAEDAVAGLLWKFNKKDVDYQVLFGYHKQDLVIGGGWAANVKGASVKGEFSYFYSLIEEKNAFAGTLGFEYQFQNSVFLSTGYLLNSIGQKEGSILQIFSFQLSARNLYPYQHSLFANVGFPITPIINGGVTLIYNPNKNHPLFFNPTIGFSIAENWDLNVVGQIIFNKEANYTSPLQASFIRMKYSF